MGYTIPPRIWFPQILDARRKKEKLLQDFFFNLWLMLLPLFADEHHTAPNKNLANFPDLNRITRSEIFLHKDSQLWAVHIILRFEPLSKRFQSPKNVTKAKDKQLA